MNKICTDLSQSKKLMELGIDVSTSDMYWEYDHNNHTFNDVPKVLTIRNWDDPYNKNIPAWDLIALLGLIPPGNILLRDALNGKYKCINTVDSSYYDNPLDAAFEIVCLLKENGKI